MASTHDSFGAWDVLDAGGRRFRFVRLGALERRGLPVGRLPYALKIVLENLLRREDGRTVTADDIEAVAQWDPKAAPSREIQFLPARVLLQDFTGVPAIVDLAAMRDAVRTAGGDPSRVNPRLPAELVIDHSIQVDAFGRPDAAWINAAREMERNHERYIFLRWGQKAFANLHIVPPGTGIVHQVNLEHLARVVMEEDGVAFPDTVIGTDSHTTMINGLGVLGWGVGGIEAEAAMLRQPVAMLLPQVVGVRLVGTLRHGATATDLVLTVTQRLRERGVVDKFVEFFGPGLAHLPLPDRATIANMAPEYGATCGLFPFDEESLRYLRLTGRPPQLVALVEAYMKEQGLFSTPESPPPEYSDVVEIDLGAIEPSMAGPRRPQDRLGLAEVPKSFRSLAPSDETVEVEDAGVRFTLRHGAVVIAAITSCTNTSNPSVMLAAGLLARKAVERGLRVPPYVKSSLAPGSQVVTDYLSRAGLTPYLDQLGFHLVGYGCTTCIGNSGPLPQAVARAVRRQPLVVAAVLSGNRNFEGRIHPDVRAAYLASPPLVVAFALAGRIDLDLTREPIGTDREGRPVFLRELWPSAEEIARAVASTIDGQMFRSRYADVFAGDELWRALPVPEGTTYAWDPASTYVRRPPYFDGLPAEPPPAGDIRGARVLALLGDSVTTDHISPAGAIEPESPAGRYLAQRGVPPPDFNTYGARRGNHEVMVRGTFANVRLRNRLAGGREGGWTQHVPSGEIMAIYEAAMRYRKEGTALLVIAGREYGSGSSRDWAAKGPALLGVRAVLAESFERIHRTNLVGMGILPLQFLPGDSAASLRLTGLEAYDILGLAEAIPRGEVVVRANGRELRARVRVDSAQEADYFAHGGILPYVYRNLLRNIEP